MSSKPGAVHAAAPASLCLCHGCGSRVGYVARDRRRSPSCALRTTGACYTRPPACDAGLPQRTPTAPRRHSSSAAPPREAGGDARRRRSPASGENFLWDFTGGGASRAAGPPPPRAAGARKLASPPARRPTHHQPPSPLVALAPHRPSLAADDHVHAGSGTGAYRRRPTRRSPPSAAHAGRGLGCATSPCSVPRRRTAESPGNDAPFGAENDGTWERGKGAVEPGEASARRAGTKPGRANSALRASPAAIIRITRRGIRAA